MSEETKRLISGCWAVDISKLSDNDRCPFQAYFMSGEPCCARWGSGTPLFPFLKECTVKDLKECPLTEYPNEANVVFWGLWLRKKGKIYVKSSLRRKAKKVSALDDFDDYWFVAKHQNEGCKR